LCMLDIGNTGVPIRLLYEAETMKVTIEVSGSCLFLKVCYLSIYIYIYRNICLHVCPKDATFACVKTLSFLVHDSPLNEMNGVY